MQSLLTRIEMHACGSKCTLFASTHTQTSIHLLSLICQAGVFCLCVCATLLSANLELTLDSSRPCQPQSPDKPSGCPIWHGRSLTHIQQIDLSGLDWTQASEHHGFSESTSLLDLHNYSTRLSLALTVDTHCRLTLTHTVHTGYPLIHTQI